ncbi:MAG: ketoacyl-ACP synthase III [Calditrichales bacterium]|nr:MAG: ketoacyl-ACP synthase III [Calditrichales bacterium]
MYQAKISGIGHYTPKGVVTNHDLEKIMDTSDEWIKDRTGIAERRWAKDGENNIDLAEKASRIAIEKAGITPEAVDFIIFATLSPDYFFPGTGCLLQERLGCSTIGALDIRNQCSGFIYGLSVADQFIKTGMYKNILLVGSEVQSRGMKRTTEGRDVAVIFGDGAGAAVISRSEDKNKGILTTHLHAEGQHAKELWCEEPGSCRDPRLSHELMDSDSIWPHMNGRYVFKHAVTRFPQVIMEALEKANRDKSEVDLEIPHQANQRITDAVRMKLDVTEDKVYSNISKYGNTTAGSIPIAMSEAIAEGRIKEGSWVCLAAFGSGFTWASALIQF